MRVLISIDPASFCEVGAALRSGADVIDLKNPREGALGAPLPWEAARAARAVGGRALTSIALGDLPLRPGTTALAAAGAARLGVDYVKAGLREVRRLDEALGLLTAVARAVREVAPGARVIAAGYADHARFGGLSPPDLARAAAESGSDGVLLDTAIKDGRSLIDAVSLHALRSFVSSARRAGLETALAGSLRPEHVDSIREAAPDLIGVRGAVCEGGAREERLSLERARAFVALVRGRGEGLDPAEPAKEPRGVSGENRAASFAESGPPSIE